MIRLATEQDIPRLVEMGRRFRGETSYAKYLSDNPEKMAQTAKMLLKQGGIVLVEENENIVGMLGYILHDHFLSGEKYAGEVFWWVEPEYRGVGLALLREAENRARQAGATQMQMIAPTKQVAAVYRYFGYGYVESTFQRAL